MAANASVLSGYNYEFVEKVPEDYICNICQLVMRDPVQTVNCGHQFCKECLAKSYQSIKQCPYDRQPLNPQDIFPNKFTERKIFSLEIKCPTKPCNWKGELRNVQTHENKCDYVVVDCDNEKCRVRKPRCDMVTHLEKECQYRKEPCPHCKNVYTFCALQKHTSECPKCVISCSNNCGMTMNRDQIASHLSEACPLTIVPCSYQAIGCTSKMERQYLNSHMDSHVKQHLDVAVEKIVSLQKQMDEKIISLQKQMDKKIVSLQKRMDEKSGSLHTADVDPKRCSFSPPPSPYAANFKSLGKLRLKEVFPPPPPPPLTRR